MGRLLMEHILAQAKQLKLRKLTSHVSHTAQPFFEHCGFCVIEQRSPIMRGVVVPNALMRKDLIAYSQGNRTDFN